MRITLDSLSFQYLITAKKLKMLVLDTDRKWPNLAFAWLHLDFSGDGA